MFSFVGSSLPWNQFRQTFSGSITNNNSLWSNCAIGSVGDCYIKHMEKNLNKSSINEEKKSKINISGFGFDFVFQVDLLGILLR